MQNPLSPSPTQQLCCPCNSQHVQQAPAKQGAYHAHGAAEIGDFGQWPAWYAHHFPIPPNYKPPCAWQAPCLACACCAAAITFAPSCAPTSKVHHNVDARGVR